MHRRNQNVKWGEVVQSQVSFQNSSGYLEIGEDYISKIANPYKLVNSGGISSFKIN